VFVDRRKYKATQGLWELLAKSKPDKNSVTFLEKQAYKQIVLQSNAHGFNFSPTGKMKEKKGIKYTCFILQLSADNKEVLWKLV
jgi:hypothetical protein